VNLAKMDSIGTFSSVASGTYRLVPVGEEDLAKMDSIVVEIPVSPLSAVGVEQMSAPNQLRAPTRCGWMITTIRRPATHRMMSRNMGSAPLRQ
jgi:hypothetical protein